MRYNSNYKEHTKKIGTKIMKDFQVAAAIAHQIAMEYVREGDDRPVVTWTDKVEDRGGVRWFQFNIYDEQGEVTGWSDGSVVENFTTFHAIN